MKIELDEAEHAIVTNALLRQVGELKGIAEQCQRDELWARNGGDDKDADENREWARLALEAIDNHQALLARLR